MLTNSMAMFGLILVSEKNVNALIKDTEQKNGNMISNLGFVLTKSIHFFI